MVILGLNKAYLYTDIFSNMQSPKVAQVLHPKGCVSRSLHDYEWEEYILGWEGESERRNIWSTPWHPPLFASPPLSPIKDTERKRSGRCGAYITMFIRYIDIFPQYNRELDLLSYLYLR